jgi:hypothetical protein
MRESWLPINWVLCVGFEEWSNSCRVCYRYDCVGFVVRTGVERRRVTITLSERERLYFNFYVLDVRTIMGGGEGDQILWDDDVGYTTSSHKPRQGHTRDTSVWLVPLVLPSTRNNFARSTCLEILLVALSWGVSVHHVVRKRTCTIKRQYLRKILHLRF